MCKRPVCYQIETDNASRYDIDNSGAIDKKEMVGVMRAIYAMVDGNVSGAVRGGTEEKASKHAEKLFVLIDTDGDGNLTEKEFLRVGKKGQSQSFQNSFNFRDACRMRSS